MVSALRAKRARTKRPETEVLPDDAKAETKSARRVRVKKDPAERATIRIWPNEDSGKGRTRTVRFGSVTASNTVPETAVLVFNVRAGREALERARDAFVNSGVQLKVHKGIPRFRVDAANPKVLIRELDGRTERGWIVDGTFVRAE